MLKNKTVSESVKKRFWSKVDIRGPKECWEWQAYRKPEGYGRFWLDGCTRYAHRVAWLLTYGPIPKKMCICHRCDNEPCCNPAHLFLGAYADNNTDRNQKGRSASEKGEDNPQSKITEEQVQAIRKEYATGRITQEKIACHYGLTQGCISLLVRRKRWNHVE